MAKQGKGGMPPQREQTSAGEGTPIVPPGTPQYAAAAAAPAAAPGYPSPPHVGLPGPVPVRGPEHPGTKTLASIPAGGVLAGGRAPQLLNGVSVDSDECFTIDPSCVGERQMNYGLTNGYEVTDRRTFTKVGNHCHAMILSSRGFNTGAMYWEFADLIVPQKDGMASADIGFKVGVVPRSALSGLDIDSDIHYNNGYGEMFSHGAAEGDLRYGDRVGVLLDLTGDEKGKLSFFVNGVFRNVCSVTGIEQNKPLYPAFSTIGRAGAQVRFEILKSPPVPDLKLHARAEQRYVQQVKEQAAQESNYGWLLRRRSPQEERRRIQIAMAHSGGTVEISSQLCDDLRLRQGDAVLFVEQSSPISGCVWQFEIENEHVLAQDGLYQHAEFDQHATQDASLALPKDALSPSGTVLKLAFKFVALNPGTAIFKSRHAKPSSASEEGTQPRDWAQTLKVVVVA